MSPNIVNPPLITIIGPTGSGKSKLALQLANIFNGAVISADSQQVYKHASIGTNQPKGQWKIAKRRLKDLGLTRLYTVNKIPHFFIDTLSPAKQFSAAEFQIKANKLIRKLSTAGLTPILAGGTGLYISAIVEGYNFPKSKANLTIRKSLNELSTKALQKKLKSLDIQGSLIVDKRNRRRLIRAIEHFMITGRSLLSDQQKILRPNTLILGLHPTKASLQKNIARRTSQMFKRGLIDEVNYLTKNYPDSTLLNSIGYRETVKYLNKEINKAEAQQQINIHTWQYARRQITWFKRVSVINWVNSTKQAKKFTEKFLRNSIS